MFIRLIAKIMQLLPEGLVITLSKIITNRLLDKYASISITGSENLQGIKTPTLFVCNHLSNSDGLVLNRVLGQYNPTFVAGMKLSGNAVTHIGINVVKTTTIEPNSADREGIKKIIDLVKAGENLLIFPEGTRSRTGSMIEGKKGILLIEKMTGAPIVPIGIYGTEKLLPINLEGDMGSEKFHKADVTINIGTQFELIANDTALDKKAYDELVLKDMMLKIAALLPDAYRGVYAVDEASR